MTLPNRIKYTPGERRVKLSPKEAPAQDRIGATPTAKRTRDDALGEELFQVLSGMMPGSTDPSTAALTHARAAEFDAVQLRECKARFEAKRHRLHADQCFQQLPAEEQSGGFSALLDSAGAAEQQSDPLDQLVTGMQSHSGLQRDRGSSRLDPQWAALFQHAGAERQQLLNRLNQLDSSASSELENVMEVLHDSPVRGKYQRAVHNVHEWGKNRLYQQLRTAMLSHTSRSSPSSPIESPFRQIPKRRTNLPKQAKIVLREWFEAHLHHPYPTEEEKEWLSVEGGITIEQVNNWFINTRGRTWKPMLMRMINEKNDGGGSKLYDKLVKKIEEPYRGSTSSSKDRG